MKKTAIALGIKCIEGLFVFGRGARCVGRVFAAGATAAGGRSVRALLPFYRAWWALRRIAVHVRLRGIARIVALLTSRTATYAAFIVIVLGVAAQSLHAREYGGFVGERPLLRAFITSNEYEVSEEVVEGPAVRSSRPAFRAASVSTALQPTVLGAEAFAVAQAPTAGFAIVQPILTDAAIEDAGRAGVATYVVEPGDTPSTIAERFGLATSTILWANNLKAWSLIRPGQSLKILPTDGVTHTIVRGDSLEKIAKKYGANAEETLEFNKLVDADDLDPGDVLIIPGGHPPYVPPPAPVVRPKAPAQPVPSIDGKFFWPSVSGYTITQYFTWRHHGVDIAVSYGTPIYAAEAGMVVSSGWLSGYGYQVTIDHGSGLQTRYAHSSQLIVAKGQRVERGQKVALVGSTGRSTGPHIHFEVFVHGTRVNPFTYLR